MSKIIPNISILFIFTKSNENYEEILFIYKKIVLDYWNGKSKLYWYYKYGKDGKSNWIWEEEKLKEWLVAGNDECINELYEDIIEGKSIEIGTKKIHFKVPDFIEKENDVDFLVRNENITYNIIKTEEKFFRERIFQKAFLNEFLGENERNNKNIKRFYPLNLFSSMFIKGVIDKNIFAINETRTSFLYLNRITHNKIKAPKDIKFIGCLQTDENSNLDYQGVLECNNTKICDFPIDKVNGIFKFSVDKKYTNVVLLIKKGSEIIKKNKLPNEFKVNIKTSIVTDNFKDEWGRSFSCPIMYKDPKFSEYYWQDKNIWQTYDYPNINIDKSTDNSIIQDSSIQNTGFKELSDIFKSIFYELGTNILIIDPYFLGDLNNNLKGCQVAFINAFNIYAFENKCNDKRIDIKFLGVLSKAKNSKSDPVSNKNEKNKAKALKDGYIKFFKNHLNKNNFFDKVNINFLKIEEVSDLKSKFHNRY